MSRLAAAAIALAVLLSSACAGSSAPAAATAIPAGSVDVLDFLIGDGKLWPRVGSFSQNQFVDTARREVCWVKYANPKRFECWTWDEDYVYHEVDHALDGDSPESYHFTDGRWMPRRVSSEWRLDVAANRIVWFDAGCGVTASRSGMFPYRQRVWLDRGRDAGADLGVRDVLVLEYQPYDPAGPPEAGPPEQFYFARGAGWYEWDRSPAHIVFNRIGGPSVLPQRDIICQR